MKEIRFIGLPEGKQKGFCEPPEGKPDDSLVITIGIDCVDCPIPECHMFTTQTVDGRIVARVFKKHPPEY